MKWLGYKQVSAKSIRVDMVDIKRRMTLQHVKDLAADISAAGEQPIHAPTIRTTDDILCGRDRYAAMLLNKTKKLWVHVAECSDAEARQLELRENIYRRPTEKTERAKQLAELVQLAQQRYAVEDEAKREAGEVVSEAPQDSPKARARRDVARAAGVSTETVKKAEQRAANSAKEAELTHGGGGTVSPAPAIVPTELPAGFQAYGLDVPESERGVVVETIEWLKGLEADARKVVAAMTGAEKHRHWAMSPVHAQAIKERAQALGQALRDAMPAGLCPYCKDRPELMDACNGCGGVGIVGRHAGDHVPHELLAADPVMVAVDGQIVPLAGWKPAKAKAKKNGKPIHVEVVDEDGAARDLTLERDAAEESEELF